MKIHFRTALRNIRRSPFQALAAVFVLAITYFVATILTILVYASNQTLHYFETKPQIIAFIKDETTREQIASFENKLKSDSRVKDVKYVSKEEALEIYKKATADNPLLSELISPSIFPASLEFSVNDLAFAQNVIDEVKSETIVDSIGFTASLGDENSLTDAVKRLKDVTLYIKIGGGLFALLLTGTSFLVLVMIIGMRMTTRRQEVEILDLIGATPGFIRSPILFEAFIYAIIGVVIGWLAAFMIVLYSTPSLVSYFKQIPILPKDALNLFYLFGVVLAVELLTGCILAFTGSYLAVSRVKKTK